MDDYGYKVMTIAKGSRAVVDGDAGTWYRDFNASMGL